MCMQDQELLTGGAAPSTVLTSSRKQQRSIRDFFISPPAIPSAKRLKTQSHATVPAQTSGTSVEAAQSSAAHCSRTDGSAAQASSASESAPCFLAAYNKEAAGSKLTQHSRVQSETCHTLQSTQHVPQHYAPSQPKSSRPRSQSGDVQQTLVQPAAVSVMSSDALQSTVNLHAVQCHVVKIPARSVAYREVKDQPDGNVANMHFVHGEKENVGEIGMQA